MKWDWGILSEIKYYLCNHLLDFDQNRTKSRSYDTGEVEKHRSHD